MESTATDDEVKKAYRKMAMKYHPDKVRGLGEQHEKAANEKFIKVQEAYEQIKKERNMKWVTCWKHIGPLANKVFYFCFVSELLTK